ncbi:lipopolysaccharide biosynthesis protein [Solibacillus cecembensis]|uniref:lipopolysaccharide biosynthesis protein n=1 Tax=Solibacillus cecembensis TaxID=459347 RepID=UPI003D07BB78
MGNEVTKSKVIVSLLWKLMERGGTQGIQFIVMIILARILLPEEFGLIILVTIFIAIAGVFVQSGFNTALIQNKDVNEIDFSSVFYLNLFVASLLYLLLFFTAPLIATFFEQPDFMTVLRVLSCTLFLGALNSIQYAIIEKKMQFKKLFLISLGANVVSGIAGIWMAYDGFGVWALVGQQLINQLMLTLFLWYAVMWRPQLLFSIERIKILFSFGWKLMASALIDVLYSNIRNVLVGKIYSPAILGFYNRGDQFPSLLVSNINGSIQSVMLPTLSSYQDDKQRVKEIVRRAIVTSAFIIFPMMVGLAVIAEPLVKILLTEKWLPTVPFLQIFCLVYALWPIHTANLQAINALGRSDTFLKLEIVKKLVGLIILGISLPFGVHAMAMGISISGILYTFINAYPNLNLLNYSIQEQWKDVLPSLLISIIMGSIIYPIQWFEMSDMLTVIIQIVTGVVLYIGLAKTFKLECFTYLLKTIKEMVDRKKSTVVKELY